MDNGPGVTVKAELGLYTFATVISSAAGGETPLAV